jgi:hypothetical protein
MPVLCPSDHAKETAYRPTIAYLVANTPSGAAGMSGIVRLTPIAGGSPAHIAQGHASRNLLFEQRLL